MADSWGEFADAPAARSFTAPKRKRDEWAEFEDHAPPEAAAPAAPVTVSSSSPFADPVQSADGKGTAYFGDEPTPFQGLKPEIAKGYSDLFANRASTVDDLATFAKANGFSIDMSDAQKRVDKRNAGAPTTDEISYIDAPRLLTDPGDGATGAAARGLGDPINMLDEMGGVVDTLGGTPGRESLLNSDRRFGDILWDNIDKNRSVLGFDDANHPYARFGGQIASGFVAPGMSIEGVGLNAGRAALREGVPMMLAREAAKKAVRNRLMLSGGIEGGLAGFGSGEDSLTDRYKNAMIGTGIGALTAPIIGAGADRLGAGIKATRQRFTNRGNVADDLATQAAEQTASAEVDSNLGPTNIVPRAAPEPEAVADDWVARDAEGRQRYQRSIGGLWQMSHDELDDLHIRAIERERQDLRAALQQSGITVSPRLLSRIENGDTEAAGRSLADEIEKQTGADLSPELQKLLTPIWADHPEGGLPNASDIADVKKAHGVGFDDDPHMLASEVGWAMRDLKPGDLEAVNRGEGSITAQAAVVSMRGAFDALRAKGVTSADMPPMVRDAMVKNGVSPSTADELTGLVFEMMRPAAERGARPGLPNTAGMSQEVPQGAAISAPVSEWDEFADHAAPISAPRAVDRIDIQPRPSGSPHAADAWGEFADVAPRAAARPMMGRATPEQIAELARRTDPRTLLPIPSNEIRSLDEAMRANPGARVPVKAPNERDALPSYRVGGIGPVRKDPIDLIGWLRTQGGLREDRGELRNMGLSNKARDLPFAKSEGFLGKIVNPDGMPLDEAALKAWEAGYFPHNSERPTVSEMVDALRATHAGGSGRVFHPDDYPALDAYQAAQAQRNAVEQADQAGRPMVKDVGRPATMADLDANQPPATAYEDLPSIGGKVGNIRVGKLSSKQDIARALQTVDNRFGGFDAARRGKIAQAETEALASELNMTPDDLLKRRRGQALNAEQALAARAILAKSGDELVTLAKSAQGGSDEALAAFRAGLVRHAAIQEQVAGATAEAGRALAQFRMDASGKLARGRMLKAVMDSGGGRDKLEDIAQKIIDLEKDPAQANKFARDIMKPGAWAMAKEYWINALLSGPRTHATNIGSNLLTSLWSLPEHAATATIGKLTRSADRMTYRDVGARAIGMMQGAKDGLKLARKAFVTGEASDHVAQVEAQNYRAIPGPLGGLIRVPTRALTAEDEFFKSIAYRGELNALAARAAYRQGGTAAERSRLYATLRDNPTDSMMDQAIKAAQYQTFQAPLKGPGVQIQMLANKGPMKLFLPFVRTPLNLLKYATERSPLAPVLSEFRDAVRKGGMARDQAIARVTMGSGLAALAVSWALDGKLSGSGPVDPREQEALRNTGWQPFSVKVGDKWYSYQRIDPFARVLSTAADFATFGDYMTEDERANTAKYLSLAIARNISTMPTLDPAASAFEALSDPDRYLTRYATNLAASAAVPNFVTQINSTLDPYMRETDGLLDTVKSRVPGQSTKLPARTNIWGKPIERGDALGPDLLSPIYTSRMKADKVLSEVARLRLGLSKPQRKVGDQRLSAKQYSDLATDAGAPAKAALDKIIANPQWGNLPDGMRRLVIKKVTANFRALAKNKALARNPDLLQAEVMAKVRRATGER